MKTELKIGDRVDVSNKITENWQTKHWLKNAILYNIEDKVNRYNKNITYRVYKVGADKNTTSSHMGHMFCKGHLSESAFNIVKHN